jgi:hypothetical protein
METLKCYFLFVNPFLSIVFYRNNPSLYCIVDAFLNIKPGPNIAAVKYEWVVILKTPT